MQTLSTSVFILAFVAPPIAVVLGAAALALLRRRPARLPAAAPPAQEAAYN